MTRHPSFTQEARAIHVISSSSHVAQGTRRVSPVHHQLRPSLRSETDAIVRDSCEHHLHKIRAVRRGRMGAGVESRSGLGFGAVGGAAAGALRQSQQRFLRHSNAEAEGCNESCAEIYIGDTMLV